MVILKCGDKEFALTDKEYRAFLKKKERLSHKAGEVSTRDMTPEEKDAFNLKALSNPINRRLRALKELNPSIEVIEQAMLNAWI
jgi:hypothetical protein|tara:strand:+ start:147 stop:398 length:252 start_codon:yes stop_codon:yes gene_type:complete